ncbi:MAG: 5-dehydro-2-deoxygluconokinase [Planctomycetota bacterium]|nr:5-dehydro-2-deoxygluconokinase [Planctomycetota bacterium]
MSEYTFPYDSSRPLDVICMGRVAVDFYAEQIGSPLEDAQSFRMYLGGCPANISVAGARLGLKPALLSHVGTDDMGKFLKNTLVREGVDITLLKDNPNHLTAIVVLGVNPPDRFPLIFYRENCADMQVQPEDADPEIFKTSKAFLFTGTCLSQPSMHAATLHAVKTAKEAGTAVVFDIDYRPVLWKLTDPGDGETRFTLAPFVTAEIQKFLPMCDLVVGTEEEILIAGGGEDLEAAVRAIREVTGAPIVQKRGEEGCAVFLDDLQNPTLARSFPVKVLNVLGAGDAFMGGFLRGWLRGEDWETCGKFGNANGALVVSRHGCAPAMSSFRELSFFMENYHSRPDILESKELELLHRVANVGNPAASKKLILAFDHRWQFETSCDEQGKDRSCISEFKEKVFDGFRTSLNSVSADIAAILIDPIYGQSVIKQAAEESFDFGMPIEASGVFPSEWIGTDSLYQQLLERPSTAFVKYLWQYHPELSDKIRQHQISRLQELDNVCNALERRLMLELLVHDDFEHNGANLVASMTDVYQSGVFPFWWKIGALDSMEEWKAVCDVIDRYDPDCRIIVLGKGAEMNRFADWFSIAKTTHHTVGFAVGRTIFWPAWQSYVSGEVVLDAVPGLITAKYLELVRVWQEI